MSRYLAAIEVLVDRSQSMSSDIRWAEGRNTWIDQCLSAETDVSEKARLLEAKAEALEFRIARLVERRQIRAAVSALELADKLIESARPDADLEPASARITAVTRAGEQA